MQAGQHENLPCIARNQQRRGSQVHADASACSAHSLQARHGRRAIHKLDLKPDLVPSLDRTEHFLVCHVEPHGHGWHGEVGDVTMLEHDHLFVRIDFLDHGIRP